MDADDLVSTPPWAKEGWAYWQTSSPKRQKISEARSPRERGAGWSAVDSSPPMEGEQLGRVLRVALEFAGSNMVLSISHDDYINIGGGLQNVIRDEQEAFCASGWAYVHLCPCHPRPHLGYEELPPAVLMVVSINGRRTGVARLSDILSALWTLANGKANVQAIVHHLLGHAPEHVGAMIEASGCELPIVWSHDLFALCPSIHLLRNDVEFCGNPAPGSSACGICIYGLERELHMSRIQAFYKQVNPIVLAPSEHFTKFWESQTALRHRGVRVAPPGAIEFSERRAPRLESERPMRIGFLGLPQFHKGWHVFEALVRWFEGDPRYSFYVLGDCAPQVPGLTHVPAQVSIGNRRAMAEAVARSELDAVINWSLCFESFSFTALEAIAGGAFVIARRDAGNVWPLVSSFHAMRGVAVPTEDELRALFISGEIRDLVSQADRRLGDLQFKSGSFEAVMEGLSA